MRRLSSGVAMLAAVGLLAFGTSGCTTEQRVKTETSLAKALISDEQSEAIGKQVHQELEKENVRFVDDSVVESYVEEVSGRIFKYAKQDRPDVDYHVHVIDDPKTVNAFATPGGHLYVYTGLLLTADNEAELAGVMAHEAGHVAGRHIERQMVNTYGLQTVTALALGNDPAMIKQLAATVAGTGLLRAHSRSEETEADEYGARYTAKAGYDPQALITFFEKLQKQEGSTPRVMAWLQTHPTSEQRIAHLEKYIDEHNLEGANRPTDRLQQVQQRLRRDGGRTTG